MEDKCGGIFIPPDHIGTMTKRECFAIIALNGLLADIGGPRPGLDFLPARAVEYADALIAELNKKTI